jgi:hypothetical protein
MVNLNGIVLREEVHPVGTVIINSSFLATGFPFAASEEAEKARIKVATTKIPMLSLLELVAPLVIAATAKEAKAINGEKTEEVASEMEVLTGALVGLGVEVEGALVFFGTKGSTSKLTVITGSVSAPEMVKIESSLFPSRSARRRGTVALLSNSTETVKSILESTGLMLMVLMLVDRSMSATAKAAKQRTKRKATKRAMVR